MCITITHTLSFLVTLVVFGNGQQIFDVPVRSCEYTIKENKTTSYINPTTNTITVSNRRVEIFINLCEPVNVGFCGPSSVACIKKRNKQKSAGTHYIYKKEDGDDILQSVNGMKCDDEELGGNYTVTIMFDEDVRAKINGIVTEVDECNYEIKIPHPHSSPFCTRNVNGYLLNLQSLKDVEELTVDKDNATYALSICKASNMCNQDDISGCQIDSQKKIIPISTVKSQYVRYNVKDNLLSVKSYYKGKQMRKKIETEVILNCNWNVDMGKLTKTNKRSTFEVQSKHGCVKLPMNCVLSYEGTFRYNLTKLNRPSGWKVDMADEILLLNVCGPLKLNGVNECTKFHSQICLLKNEIALNYGSTSKPIYEENNNLYLELMHGSTCPHNKSKVFSSKVEFVCSRQEMGPVFVNMINCTTTIRWRTPQACPFEVTDMSYNRTRLNSLAQKGSLNCKIREDAWLYDLTPLMAHKENYIFEIENEKYYINICRPLVVTDDTFLCRTSGVCRKNVTEVNMKKKFRSYHLQALEVVNGTIVQSYLGGLCNYTLQKVNIRFHCSDVEKKMQLVKNELCLVEFLWETTHACPKHVHKTRSLKCVINNSFGKPELELNNISKPYFSLLYNNDTFYELNLCQYNFTMSPILDKNNITLNSLTNIQLKKENCESYLEYTFPGSECTNSTFKTLRLYLSCNKNSQEDEYEYVEPRNTCMLVMRFNSGGACNIENKTDQCVVETKEITTKTEVGVTLQLEKKPKNCSMIINKSTFQLQKIVGFTVTSKNNNYQIGYPNPNCDGYICKNHHVIASLKDICPNMELDSLNSEINVHFISSENQSAFNTHLIFKCSEEEVDPNIIEETKSNLKLEIFSNDICQYWSQSVNTPTSVGVRTTIGVFGAILILFVILGLIYKYRYKCGIYKSLDSSDKYRTRIYMRDTSS